MGTEVGVRELKHGLKHCLARVEAGEILTVTMRGRPIARLTPVGNPDVDDVAELIAAGVVQWSGKKPRLIGKGPRVRGKVDIGSLVTEQRR